MTATDIRWKPLALAREMSDLCLSLFGSFEARAASGEVLTFTTRKAKALLAYLALHQNTVMDRKTLRELLWSDRDIEHGRGSLRQALKSMHDALGPAVILSADRNGVGFVDQRIRVDVADFERGARSDDLAEVKVAVRLYRGDFLADLDIPDPAYRAWRSREASRLRNLLLEALETLVGSELQVDPTRAVETARRIVAIEPTHEMAHGLVIGHHRRLGQMRAAAEQYEALRAALKAIGALPSAAIESLSREGARELTPAGSDPVAPAARSAAPQPPSIAVLPFTLQGGDESYAYFADGVTEDILTALSRLPWLTVIARGSTFTYRGDVDVRDVCQDLGVRYVLQGTVRRSSNRVRIAGRLSDTARGRVLWADIFDSNLQEVFDLQDKVTEAVISAIAPRIEAAEIERARAKRPGDLNAWDLYLQALPFHYAMTQNGHEQAIQLLRASLQHDPTFAPALGLATWAYTLRVPQRWGDLADAILTGLHFARRTISAGQEDADALAMGGYGLAYLARDLDGGLRAVDRAIILNSNAARAFAFSGWVRGYAGDHETAVAHFQRALRLSPRDPIGFRTRGGLAFSLLFLGRLEDALAEAERAHQEGPAYVPAHRVLAVTLAHMGRIDEAREIIRQLRVIAPDVTTTYAIAECRYTRSSDIERLREGYLRAGLPR